MRTKRLMILAGDRILKNSGKVVDGIEVTQYADLLYAGAEALEALETAKATLKNMGELATLLKDMALDSDDARYAAAINGCSDSITQVMVAPPERKVMELSGKIYQMTVTYPEDEGGGMKSLWVEGYAATGESGTARYLGIFPGDTLREAVVAYMNGMQTDNDRSYIDLNTKIPTYWGCRFYDNEDDARKFFG
jgi:hypothetical protein